MTQMKNCIHFDCNYSKKLFTIAIDIGGTLAKVVYSPLCSNTLCFDTIESARIDDFILLLHNLVKDHNNNDYQTTQIIATGGGAYKFYNLLTKEFSNIKSISRFDEMECLIKGLNMFIHKIKDEVFTYNDIEGMKIIQHSLNSKEDANNNKNIDTLIYPYLLVNIGSGVSILKVESPNEFSRVGGSSLGGGTLWGLLSLITGAKTYDEMLSWAQEGDNTNVDMLVGDIYGSGYSNIGLKSTHIASSFAKVFENRSSSTSTETKKDMSNELENLSIDDNENPNESSRITSTEIINRRKTEKSFRNEDISKSLLYAISNNIGQIAYLQAKIHNVHNIYFGGSYIRGHLTTMNTLSYAINFWSDGTKQAFFLKHEGYLGAMGAFLSEVE
ncbi:hypothetical protein TPHA_0E03890 [Tetrapisispora phaffii CBS 4417]|uniref:Pantothenate kinase n=1 Tax=Tetrapisispora phaffii (strain ATCC 24235 / CBS 4417 / NBRC 1672 / NRRL Y-8282 / UCD 70-5) TaxID=1071381 RepID=G8BUA0_TETPH|nr:hypothetical protein TPHA_0E03890 [Tetrapisispora phaffii CBS 4417]CCE63478.1 hypothetical protein TPHA_0E03890 [Tetrapisispora phaffii CBS 4417]